MLMTTMAVLDLGVRQQSLLARLRGWFRGGSDRLTLPLDEPTVGQPARPHLCVVPPRNVEPHSIEDAEAAAAFRWRRHPVLLAQPRADGVDASERRARQLAVKGLLAANEGNAPEALSWFVQAVVIAPIDLTDLPSFWQMPRASILAAAEAYEMVGRHREAAAVQARVRTELRPRNVVPIRREETAPEPRRLTGAD